MPAAHQGRVTVVLFVLEIEWVLSTGQDKNFTWHCSESGQQLGTYRTAAWVSGLQYPSPANSPGPSSALALSASVADLCHTELLVYSSGLCLMNSSAELLAEWSGVEGSEWQLTIHFWCYGP